MDHVSKKIRSKIMAAVRSTGNTTTELPLRRLLRATGIKGFRSHLKLPGKPDFAWRKYKVAVFVDGCFWHGCECKYLPRTNIAFWRHKIETNKRRDRRVSRMLKKSGWKVLRIRECSVRRPSTISRIAKALQERAIRLGRAAG